MDIRQQIVTRYIDAGLFIRHIDGKREQTTGERVMTSRGFNTAAERDAFMAQYPTAECAIVRPGDAEDPRAQ